jgi:hypothetical protein
MAENPANVLLRSEGSGGHTGASSARGQTGTLQRLSGRI